MGSLDLMFQNGMKNMGAFGLGQQMVSDQQMAAQDLRAKQLANDQTAVMNPLNAQFRQGQITEQQAQLPGIMGQSQTLASEGQVSQATTGARIAQRLSSLANQIGVDGMQKMGREGAMAAQAAEALKNYPPALHKEVLPKLYAQYGGDPNSPMIQGILKNVGDGQVADSLASLGKGMAMASQDYMQKSALQGDELRNRKDIAEGNNRTSIRVAEITAASREAAAKARAGAIKHMSTDQAIAFLEMQPERTPEEEQQLKNLKTQKLQERAAGANAVPATVLGQPTPMQQATAVGQGTPGPRNFEAATGSDKTITRTGTVNGRKVIQYSDGSIEYAN